MNTTTSSKNLIDFDQLQSAADGDVALMRDLMEMYFTQAAQIMADLKKAVEGRDVAGVDHCSHKLAGSSLACGLSAIVPALRRMEMNAKAGHLDGADASFAEAAEALQTLRAAMDQYLAALPNS